MENRGLLRRGSAGRLVRGLRSPALALVTLTIGSISAVAMASMLAFVVALVLSAVHGVVQMPVVRQRRARRAAAKQHRVQCDRRERVLVDACVATYELEDLSLAVDQIAALDETTARDVEPLLDRYVDVACARKRCAATLSQADASKLELQLAIARETHPRQARVLERRIAHARVLAERFDVLDAKVGELADLIRYYAARATLPDTEPLLEHDSLAAALLHYDAVEATDVALAEGRVTHAPAEGVALALAEPARHVR